MAFFTKITSKYFEQIVKDFSDLPSPDIDGKIYLEDNITYRFQGLLTGSTTIVVGASNTIMGFDKSNDGYNYTGTGNTFEVVNQTCSFVNLFLVVSNPLGQLFSVANTTTYSFQIRECIIAGAGQAGHINGSNIVAINNNIHSSNLGYGWDFTGTINKIGIGTNYFENGLSEEHLHFETGTYNIIKVIDNDFTVTSPNMAILVDNDVDIIINGGGSIVGNTFSGNGIFVMGIDTASLSWIIENNGREILSTSETVTQKKVRSEEELQQYLALPDPTIYSYLIDAKEFVITQSIVVPSGGVNGGLTFFGLGNNFTAIKSGTPNMEMFTGGGNLFLNDMIINADASGSTVFGMTSATGFEAVEMLNVNFQFCESLGYLNGFRQGLLINGFMIGDKEGLEFRGTWSGGFRISDSRFIFTPSVGSYMFKGAVGQTFGSRFISNANSTIGTGSIGYDFTEANFINDANFQLIEAQFNGGGTYVNGINQSSKKSLWRDCVGADDTFQGCVYRNAADTITTIASAGVYVELAVDNQVLEDVWNLSQSATAFHALYDSSLPINERIDLILALQSGNNHELEIEVRKYNSANNAFSVIDNFKMTSNGGTLGTRVEPISLTSFTRRTQSERVRIFIRNNTANSNIITEESSKLIISKR
jgi:hypothetical protein